MAARYHTGGGEVLASPSIEIQAIGSSGAASPERRSASFLVGGEIAVDAGALASGLSLEEERRIRTVLLTHRHFDHLRDLPLFLDNVYPDIAAGRSPPVAVGAEKGTLSALFRHVFNWEIWPDIRRFRPPQARFFPVRPGKPFRRMGLRIVPLRLFHTVPSVGYVFRKGGRAAAVLGDTGFRKSVFEAIARIPGLQFMTIEVSYPSRLPELARIARHLTPDLLGIGLAAVRRAHPRLRVLATHLKPPWVEEIEEELEEMDPPVLIARDGARYEFL